MSTSYHCGSKVKMKVVHNPVSTAEIPPLILPLILCVAFPSGCLEPKTFNFRWLMLSDGVQLWLVVWKKHAYSSWTTIFCNICRCDAWTSSMLQTNSWGIKSVDLNVTGKILDLFKWHLKDISDGLLSIISVNSLSKISRVWTWRWRLQIHTSDPVSRFRVACVLIPPLCV